MVKKTKTIITEEFLKKTCDILRDMSRSKENYEMLLRPYMQDPIKFDRVTNTLQKMILDNYNSSTPRLIVRPTKAQVAEAKAKKAAKAKMAITTPVPKLEPSYPFKVGDLVVGKLNNGYAVTNQDCTLKVIATYNEFFSAEMVNHKNARNREYCGSVYDELGYNEFELYNHDKLIKPEPTKPKKAKLSIQETKDIIASMHNELEQLEEQITRYQTAITTLVESLEEV